MQKKKLSFVQILGIGLIFCGVCLLLFFQLRAHLTEAAARTAVSQVEALLPERTRGVPGIYTDPAMPVFQVAGEDYICLADVPAFGITLPVSVRWEPGKLTSHPCRFWGSVYENSLVIGGADQKGQFDFCDRIDIGTVVRITDMTGAEFTYTVKLVERSEHADTNWLLSEDYDLTLFARSDFSLEYIAVRCTLSS